MFDLIMFFSGDLVQGYRKDIKAETVHGNGAPARDLKIHKDTLIAKFRRQDLPNIVSGTKNTLTGTGTFGGKYPYGNLTFVGKKGVFVLR